MKRNSAECLILIIVIQFYHYSDCVLNNDKIINADISFGQNVYDKTEGIRPICPLHRGYRREQTGSSDGNTNNFRNEGRRYPAIKDNNEIELNSFMSSLLRHGDRGEKASYRSRTIRPIINNKNRNDFQRGFGGKVDGSSSGAVFRSGVVYDDESGTPSSNTKGFDRYVHLGSTEFPNYDRVGVKAHHSKNDQFPQLEPIAYKLEIGGEVFIIDETFLGNNFRFY